MIYSPKYNGINFSGDFNRTSEKYNYSLQRRKGVLFKKLIGVFQINTNLSFHCDYANTVDSAKLHIISSVGVIEKAQSSFQKIESNTKIIFNFTFATGDFTVGRDVHFKFEYNGQYIYSEFYEVTDGFDVCLITGENADDRHGYLSNESFGIFRYSTLKRDIFINKKVEYEYSYGRKKILSSENQIAKRFTFTDLTMYYANLLKWLCNCESFAINGTSYQLISDFTELESDPNSEVLSLQADFVEVNQSFVSTGATELPTNIFIKEFFN